MCPSRIFWWWSWVPTIEEISHKLAGAKVFSKLDARHGYWGIHLDEESSKLCTFQSPAGKYRFMRLPFGLSVSQDVFQARMDDILAKVGYGAVGIADDVIIHWRNVEEHDTNLVKLMQVAKQEGLVFWWEKCWCKTRGYMANTQVDTLDCSSITFATSSAVNNFKKESANEANSKPIILYVDTLEKMFTDTQGWHRRKW